MPVLLFQVLLHATEIGSVHPDIHNKTLRAEIAGPRIELTDLHSKVRCEGYRDSRKRFS